MSTPSLPTGPIERDPIDYYRDVEFPEIRATVDDALSCIELGAFDRRMLEWLKGWDQPTMITIASWIVRAHNTPNPQDS